MKKCLDDAGIPSYYGPKVVDDLRLLPTPFPRWVQVKLREVDRDRANFVLNRCLPPSPDNEKEEEEEIPEYTAHCPKCHSAEIVFEGLDDPEAESNSGSKYNWSCDACGHHWQDDGVESKS